MVQIPQNITNEQETAAPANMYLRNAYSPDAFGGEVAKGLGRFSELEYKLQDERKKDNDETAALDAYAKAAKAKSYELYDPEKGLYSRQGDQVNGIVDDFERKNREIGESASQGLNPEAKRHFDKMWQRSEGPDREGIMRHEFGERQKHRLATGNAVIDLAISNAANDYANPDVISRSKSEILGAVIQSFPGASKETIADKVLEGYSALHKGVVMKLSVESPSRAEQYYNEHKDEFTGGDHVAISNYLRGQIFRSNVLRDAERISSNSGPVKKLYDTFFQGNVQGRALGDALTRQESGFKPTVRAYNDNNPEKTAVGLTQVLVGTAREISAELGDGVIKPNMTPKEIEAILEKPDVNLRYGMHYLGKQLKKYGGDLEAALIAYNAGPGNADKWLRAGRDYGVLPDRKQTEPYVRNVMSMYRRNLGDQYPRTAQNMDDAGVRPSATDAQLESFRTHFNPADAGGGEINGAVEDGAARMWEAMPDLVKQGIQMTAAGGDIQLSTDDVFSRDWIMMNAETFGINATELDNNITLSSGAGPSDMGVMIKTEEYDLNEWLQEAAKIQDPARRDAVTRELMRRHGALQKATKQDENTLKRQAWQMVLEGQEVPIEIQKELTPEYMSTLREYQKKIAKEGKIETDWELWTKLRLQTDEELKSMGDLMVYRSRLGDTEFKTLVDMVREAKGEGDPAKKGLVGAVRTRTQIVDDTVKTYYKHKPAMAGKLNAALDQEISAFFDTYKKQPTAIETQAIVDRLILNADTYERGDVPLFDVRPGETIDEPVVAKESDIPAIHMSVVGANAKKAFGRPLTAEELPWAYTAALAFKRGAYVRTPSALREKMIAMGFRPDRIDFMFGRVAARLFEVK